MKKLNMAILGFGLFGEKSLLPGYQQSKLTDLVAITKRNKEAAVQKAEQYGIKYGYANDERKEMLANDEIEGIFIATPNFMHLQDTLDCLEAGKDVLLENRKL